HVGDPAHAQRAAPGRHSSAPEARMIPVSYNVRSLLARRSTTLAAALGIALVTFVFAAVLMLANGLEKTLGASGSPDNAIILRKGSLAETTSGIGDDVVSIVRASPEG